ncbi:hypothetical protein ACWE42_10335 [Sutcliffiella cohnii]
MKKSLLMMLIGVGLIVVCFSLSLQSAVSGQEKICNAIKKADFGCEKVFSYRPPNEFSFLSKRY